MISLSVESTRPLKNPTGVERSQQGLGPQVNDKPVSQETIPKRLERNAGQYDYKNKGKLK